MIPDIRFVECPRCWESGRVDEEGPFGDAYPIRPPSMVYRCRVCGYRWEHGRELQGGGDRRHDEQPIIAERRVSNWTQAQRSPR
jgi:hypothetical protein